jgi:acetolactate synthase-1/2/3 large subunit
MLAKAAIAHILKAEGVEFLSCFPNSSLIDACAREGIRPIVARSERVVVNIADGYSRAAGGGRVGVCAMQDGAGIENAFAGVAQAFGDSVPVLVLPGHYGRGHVGVPPDFDAVANFRHVTKWAAQLNEADRVDELLRRAFVALRTGRPGPVLLEVPKDVAEEEVGGELTYKPVPRFRSGPDAGDVEKTVSLILAATRPVLLVGQGIHYAEAWDGLQAFAELLRMPVMTSMGGKSALPENHPLALGVAGLTTTAMVDHFLQRTDLIVAIGSSLTSWWMFPPLPKGVPIVQSTIDERDLGKDNPIEHAVLGDAKLVLEALTSEARRRLDDGAQPAAADPTDEIRVVKDAWLADWLPRLTSDEVPINPYRVVWELASTIDRRNAIVTHDSGNPRDQAAPFFETVAPRSYVGWGHSTQLGYSLGLAMGMKLARPDRLVVNLMGDAAFGMAGMDFETASRSRIGTLTVVMNNSLMGNYDQFIPFATEHFGSRYLTGDMHRVAEALGGAAERVTEPSELAPALRRAIEVTRTSLPALVEVITKEERAFSKYW